MSYDEHLITMAGGDGEEPVEPQPRKWPEPMWEAMDCPLVDEELWWDK